MLCWCTFRVTLSDDLCGGETKSFMPRIKSCALTAWRGIAVFSSVSIFQWFTHRVATINVTVSSTNVLHRTSHRGEKLIRLKFVRAGSEVTCAACCYAIFMRTRIEDDSRTTTTVEAMSHERIPWPTWVVGVSAATQCFCQRSDQILRPSPTLHTVH